jgi:hypothetical protein
VAETKLHKDQARASKGTRIVFDHDKQAWLPVNGSVPEGSVTATLKADAVYEKKVGMRSRAIDFAFDSGPGDDEAEPSEPKTY